MRIACSVGVAACVAALVASCAGGGNEAKPAVRTVTFAGLHGTVYGSGRGGVVLANQSDRGREAWAPFARFLAAHGLRVLTFDYGGGSPENEVVAASRELRRLGSRHVVLAGASEGAKAAVMAGAGLPPGVEAVVSLAAERYAAST